MANKKALLGSTPIKVENMSGFDKSNFHALTAPLGAIVPLRSQLMIPGKFNLSVKVSASLPPLATDAFLRTHLKVEAFLVPLRLCYGGFESWYSGREIGSFNLTSGKDEFTRAKLPYLHVGYPLEASNPQDVTRFADTYLGVHTLMDYFGVHWVLGSDGKVSQANFALGGYDLNIFPFICYQLIYDHWYRNKLVEKPLFAPVDYSTPDASAYTSSFLPYMAFGERKKYFADKVGTTFDQFTLRLLNGTLLDLRYRNYGFDYFTTALPSPQEGNPMSVDTSGGSFTISALRLQNSLQHFSEINQVAGPDMVQVNKARYGVDLSDGVAQRPILLGSADFPMFTSGVEQTAQGEGNGRNPFGGIAARYGRAHAEGTDFVCEGQCKEPSYLMVVASLVPEANYADGIPHDMRIFTEEGSLVDLPVAALEQSGYEPVMSEEVYASYHNGHPIFGYQPRYMWHKAGAVNRVSGLLRENASLSAFVPKRWFNEAPQISSAFLKVSPYDLDEVMAVESELSNYGVIIDSKIDLFVSEPLGESVLPSLVDPAAEHGYTVYVKRGGSSVND